MQAVEKLSSYITQGVYSVSGPFHPFGGAVDIIVVEQQDGSFKSSPWYVRFGKFLGVLKTREMVVKIFVNGQEANFHMYLDHKGEAFFLKESGGSDDDEAALSPRSSSGEEIEEDGQSRKSHVGSCETESISKIDVENGKIVGRTDSRRSTIFGFAFGKKSTEEEEGRNDNAPMLSSLEHAEIAADLLETKWSTNLPVTNRSLVKGRKIAEEACKTEDLQQEGTGGGNSGGASAAVDAQEEHFGESKVEFSPSLRTRGELLELYSSENGDIVNRHEIFSDIPAETDIPQLETSFQDSSRLIRERIVDIQSSEFALVSNKNDGVSDETGDSLTSRNFIDGRENASYIFYETIQSSTVRIGVADGKAESDSPLVRAEEGENNDGILVESIEHLSIVEPVSAQEALSKEEHVAEQKDRSNKSQMRTIVEGLNDVPDRVHGGEEAPFQSLRQGVRDEDEELENSLPVTSESSLQTHESQTDKVSDNVVKSEAIQTVSSSYTSKETKDTPVAASRAITGSEDQESRAVVQGMETNTSYPSVEINVSVGTTLSESSNLDEVASPRSLVLSTSEDEHVAFSDVDNDATGASPVPIEEKARSEEKLFPELEENAVQQELHDVNGEASPNCLPEAPITSPINIPIRKKLMKESDRLVRSLPNVPSQIHHLDMSDNCHPLSTSFQLNSQRFDTCIPKEVSPISSKSEQVSPISAKFVQVAPISANFEEGSTSEHVQAEPTSEDASELSRESLCGTSVEKEKPNIEMSLCRHLLFEGMGVEAASKAFDSEKVDLEKFTALGPSIVKNKKLIIRIRGRYFPWNVAAPIILGMVSFEKDQIFESEGIRVEKPPSSSGGQWGLWPFRFNRTRTMKSDRNNVDETDRNNVDETDRNNVDETDRNNVDESETKEDKAIIHSEGVSTTENEKPKPRQTKTREHFITPSPDQLASLNLKEGRNSVSFCFESAMLGRQQVDARIYLWKWNTRIVISDVDGTITKSDVLGQFMPLVGKDWSQTGVAHLFSSIKDNGYEFIFLSARAIAQAYLTRQFLFNLKQDGKSLPDGPVVISPDGLFPSLYREVIRRAPHEFKIACLEEIRALFPPECNPFYAGFGNRHTDEISYLKVGIPKGKIFIINPRGQVAVNNLVNTRSYTSLNALVNGMFPPMAAVEQEEFNNWNYWRLPLPDID